MKQPKYSPFFPEEIGLAIRPQDFDPANYEIPPYKRESSQGSIGNWIFVRFDHPEILGARLGFAMGGYDARDFGIEKPPGSCLILHFEVLTKSGAYLWLNNDSFSPEEVQIGSGLDFSLSREGNRIFHISGWPCIHWCFASEDGILQCDLELDVHWAMVAPDIILPRNYWATWTTAAALRGTLSIGDSTEQVSGMAHYDHPRFKVGANEAIPFGWLIYLPIRLDNGSVFICYYIVGEDDCPGDCLGTLVAPDGSSSQFSEIKIEKMTFASPRDPQSLSLRWQGDGGCGELSVRFCHVPVLKAWGSQALFKAPDGDPASVKPYAEMPLMFDVEGIISSKGESSSVRGNGLAEFFIKRGHTPTFP